MPRERVVLITGASRGLGRAAAELLSLRGCRVFGTSRHPQPDPPRGYEMLTLDVRSDESVQACVSEVLRRAGRIDVLVNNAGYGLLGLIEEASIEQVREQFETNVFGVVRMTQAVLPAMRDQLAGRIINIGSMAGIIGVPGEGHYCATKFALEGLTETLYYEVEPFGIHACLVEPGFFATAFSQNVIEGNRALPAYDTFRRTVAAALEAGAADGAEPRRFAELIWRIINDPRPRLRYPVGDGSARTAWLKALLPMQVFACGVRRRFGIRRRTWKRRLLRARRALRPPAE